MNGNRLSLSEVWREFDAAVTYVAEMERPGLTIWQALAEALQDWAPDGAGLVSNSARDPLRAALTCVFNVTPELGAPGGVSLGSILDSAMQAWSESVSQRLNNGFPFFRCSGGVPPVFDDDGVVAGELDLPTVQVAARLINALVVR